MTGYRLSVTVQIVQKAKGTERRFCLVVNLEDGQTKDNFPSLGQEHLGKDNLSLIISNTPFAGASLSTG